MPGLAGTVIVGVEVEGLRDLVARALGLDYNRALALTRRVIEIASEGVQGAVEAVGVCERAERLRPAAG